MQLLQALGFGVLGIDYRGFGRSSPALPSEASACEDTHAAWQWLAQRHPQARRFVYGHSLGGALAIALASSVDDAAGLIVEGTFTSIPEVYASLSWGWLPLRRFITQRFDSAHRVAQVRSPMLVVHGSADKLIGPAHGRALFDRARVPKRFVLVDGGSHHDTHVLGREAYRLALREMFAVPPESAPRRQQMPAGAPRGMRNLRSGRAFSHGAAAAPARKEASVQFGQQHGRRGEFAADDGAGIQVVLAGAVAQGVEFDMALRVAGEGQRTSLR